MLVVTEPHPRSSRPSRLSGPLDPLDQCLANGLDILSHLHSPPFNRYAAKGGLSEPSTASQEWQELPCRDMAAAFLDLTSQALGYALALAPGSLGAATGLGVAHGWKADRSWGTGQGRAQRRASSQPSRQLQIYRGFLLNLLPEEFGEGGGGI